MAASPSKQVRFSKMPTPAIDDYYGGQTLTPSSRGASVDAMSGSPRSPLLKKFAPVQDRRVNTILLESLQLVEFTKEELCVIEKSVKRLRDAIHGFAILVDKQVNIIGAESLEERGRVKADIQDLCENLKTSNALLDSTCARMKKHLSAGKNQIHAHKRRLVGKAASELVETAAESCAAHHHSVNESNEPQRSPSSRSSNTRAPYGISIPGGDGSQSYSPSRPTTSCGSSSPGRQPLASSSPVLVSHAYSPTKVPLMTMLEPGGTALSHDSQKPQVYLSPDFFSSVCDAVGISEKEFLDPKDLARFVHEMLTFLIARSGALTFMGKAHHRQLIPKYANEVVRLILQDLQPVSLVRTMQ